MSKIVLLYKSRHEGDNFYSSKIHGGIEKFARQLGEAIPDIIPIVVDPEQRAKRQTKQIIAAGLHKHNPDVVISNDIDSLYTNFVVEQGYPLVSVIHEPNVGDIRYVELGKRLIELNEMGGHIYFVSRNQFQFHSTMCERLQGVSLPEPTGYIPSSYCSDDLQMPGEIRYSAGTIGRTDPAKDPFLLHRKLKGTGMDSIVVTDTFKGTKKNGSTEKYREANAHWEPPQYTVRDQERSGVLETLSHMGSYVSTMTVESWGITALEALGTGIPLILLTDKTGNHSSEDIPVSKDHYIKLRKNCSKEDLVEAIKTMNAKKNREEIAELTRKRHTKENWNKIITDVINKRLDDKMNNNEQNIMNFFDG